MNKDDIKNKYHEKYKKPPPPDDIVRCLNETNDMLSGILTELRELNSLLRYHLYIDKKD